MLGAYGILPFSDRARLRPSTRRKSLWSVGCTAIRVIPSTWACSLRLLAGPLCSEERTCLSTHCAWEAVSTYLSCSTRSAASGDSSGSNIRITAKRSVDGCRVFTNDRPSNRAWTRMFRLRFPEREIEYWASRYSYTGEEEIENRVAPAARKRGYLTRQEF